MSDQSEGSALKAISEHVALIYGGLVLIGYVNLHTYFNRFGIEIWTYLSPSELLLSFLPLLAKVLGSYWFVVLLFVGFMLMAYHLSLPSTQTELEPLTPEQQKNMDHQMAWEVKNAEYNAEHRAKAIKTWHGRLSYWLYDALQYGQIVVTFGGAVVIAIGAPLIMIYAAHEGQLPDWLKSGTFVYLACVNLVFIVIAFSMYAAKRNVVRGALLFSVAFGVPLLTLTAANRVEAGTMLLGKGTRQVTIVTNGQTYKTDEALIYVGRCNTHVFMFDGYTKNSVTIPVSDIKTMMMDLGRSSSPHPLLKPKP